MSTPLQPGQNAPLAATAVTVTVTGAVDLTALILSADGKVAGDADMVFYNQPGAPGAELAGPTLTLELTAMRPGAERVVVVASPAEEGLTFASLSPPPEVAVTAGGDGVTFAATNLAVERAAALVEVYLRNGAWKVRALGQGWADGLAGLARDFGVDVGEPEPAPPAAPAPAAPVPPPAAPAPAPLTPPAAPAPPPPAPAAPAPAAPAPPPAAPFPAPLTAPTSGLDLPGVPLGIHFPEPEESEPARPPPDAGPTSTVDLKKRRLVDMEKRVAAQAPDLVSLVKVARVSLEKRGLGDHTARVALALDISASMYDLYRSGAVQQLAERALALGLRFDDDGEVDVFLFGRDAHAVGTLGLDNRRSFVDQALARHPLEGRTNYGSVMAMIRQHYFGSSGPRDRPCGAELPVFVEFITDGEASDPDEARRQVVASSYEPLFWQFMAIGNHRDAVDRPPPAGAQVGYYDDFGLLDELDDLRGRLVDNANFFAVTDPRNVTDEQLLDLMMTEYPGWLPQARRASLLP